MKPIALALSGSGFLATVHVGAICALIEAGYYPVSIDSTSGGSVVAGLFAAGLDSNVLKAVALNTDFSNLLTFNLLAPFRQSAYCDGSALLNWLESETGELTLGDINLNLNIVSTDLISGGKVLLNKETQPNMPLALAIRASSAIPYVYAAVQYNGMYLVDGGTTNNIDLADLPSSLPRLGVELTRKIVPMSSGNYSAVSLAERLLEVVLSAGEDSQVQIGELENAIVATVDVTGYGMLNTNMNYNDRITLFNRGYDAVTTALGKL